MLDHCWYNKYQPLLSYAVQPPAYMEVELGKSIYCNHKAELKPKYLPV